MNPRKNKNDYSCIIFLTNGNVMKQPYVHNIYSLVKWLESKRIEWRYINIYLRRTSQYISRQYPNSYVVQKP